MNIEETCDWLIEPYELEARLDDPELRIIDATLFARLGPGAKPIVESGKGHWRNSHIPGAVYIDIFRELSDPNADLPSMAPTPDQFEDVLGRNGISTNHNIVIYSAENQWWSTRIWWLLRLYGFNRIAVLNGGYATWLAEGRPTSNTASLCTHVSGGAVFQPQFLATQDDVLLAMKDHETIIVNGLPASQHSGREDPGYGRPGHITGSLNIPAANLLDENGLAFLPRNVLLHRLGDIAPSKTVPIICYCGGGIAGSILFFAFSLCGYQNVRLYDASLREWAPNTHLPMSAPEYS